MLVQTPLTIAEKANTCLESFARCIEQATVVRPLKMQSVEYEHARFNVWAANADVFDDLDFRLRDEDQLRLLLIERLESLTRSIEECTSKLQDQDHDSNVLSDSGFHGSMNSIAIEATRLIETKFEWPPRDTLHDKIARIAVVRDRIQCTCGLIHDDGATILCEGCSTWQHISCYYGPNNTRVLPDVHKCTSCRPRIERAMPMTADWMEGRQQASYMGNPQQQQPLQNFCIIQCTCGSNIDDGNIVFCIDCAGWQHVRCYYPVGDTTKNHRCRPCLSKASDAELAAQLQNELENGGSSL